MKKIYFFLLLFCSSISYAQVVINEVYGGGGNTGATYKNDFIELYNLGATSVDLTGWSVQYASANGTSWATTGLTGSIAAGGYYLIQENNGTGGTVNLPNPDATGTIQMSGTAGKVILVNTSIAQTGSCPAGPAIIDKVGFGTPGAANPCFEGSGTTPSPSNTTSISRNATTHADSDNNNADFTTGAPSPINTAGPDVTAPIVTSYSPVNGSTGVALIVNATLTFNENVSKGVSGSITLKQTSDNAVVQTIDITTSAVTITQNTVTFTNTGLSTNTSYYYEISAGALKDIAGNNYAGITGNTTWNFTTGSSTITGILNFNYDLENCVTNIPDGFTQYNVLGAQVWGCTTFGRDPANPTASVAFGHGVQMNGFSGGNIPNEDWFISPSFDLSATNFPLLSFWSRTAFTGSGLQLKVSTNYDGSGDPQNFTWITVNGKFPAASTDVWTNSDNIDLSAYKSANTYFAFVYSSTNTTAARWTLDDIKVTNATTAPAPFIAVDPKNLQFGFVTSNTSSVKTFVLDATNLLGVATITASTDFLVSKTNGAFTNSITYTATELNNKSSTIYVQFLPPVPSKNYSGTVSVSTINATTLTVNLSGNSVDPANTLEVVNWNIEWFGSLANGPTNKNLQESNIKTITQNIHADIYALTEVVDEVRLQNVVNNLNSVYGAGTYAYTISDYGSHTNPFENGAGPLDEAQKESLIYNTSVVSIIGTPKALVTEGPNTVLDLTNPAYNYFSSGRYPYMVNTNVTLNGITNQVRFVILHAKANVGAPANSDYIRRKKGSDSLHFTLNNLYPNDNIILLGDFNDDLDESVAAGNTITSYIAFTNDVTNFYSPTLALSLAGRKSTVGFNDMIDHVELSNEMKPFYMTNTADVLTAYTAAIPNYGTTTTDHYPIFTRYAFDPLILPVNFLEFTATKVNNSSALKWSTSKEFNVKNYLVERSADGINFNQINLVKASNLPNSVQQYNYVDNSPLTGNNYYRIKAIDMNGSPTLTKVQLVFFGAEQAVLLYPNPATDFALVKMNTISDLKTEVTVFSEEGKKIVKVTSAEQTIKINTRKLSKGTYYLQIKNGDFLKTEKLLVM